MIPTAEIEMLYNYSVWGDRKKVLEQITRIERLGNQLLPFTSRLKILAKDFKLQAIAESVGVKKLNTLRKKSECPTVLVVDDNPENLNLLFDILNKENFKVLTAENGKVAINCIHITQPDIILLDIIMPGIDGFETCSRIKELEETKDIPVIFLTALANMDDKIAGFKSGAVDYITKPFNSEEVLARVNTHLKIQQLQKEDQTKLKFLSTVSHELRTPLAPVKSFIENLLCGIYGPINKIQQDRFTRALSRINEEVSLIDSLLDLVRIQSKKMKLHIKSENIRDIINDVVHIYEYQADKKNIILRTVFPEKADVLVHIDKEKIKRVLSNLIDNAIKFTFSKGIVTISLLIENKKIKVIICDTGIGISKKELHKIFDRFYQIDNSTTRETGGTGIGLNIAKEYIELHKGEIHVESELGKGTSFIFTLPGIGTGLEES